MGKEYIEAHGIRADEPRRIGKRAGVIYPLFDFGIDKAAVMAFWAAQPFDLQVPEHLGNCDLCMLKSKKKRVRAIAENPRISDWWEEMEAKYGDEKQPIFDVRGKLSVKDLKRTEQLGIDAEVETSCFCGNT